MYNQIPILATLVSGGVMFGMFHDRVDVLCKENEDMKKEQYLLKEKLNDIHIKVCNIDNKLNCLIEK